MSDINDLMSSGEAQSSPVLDDLITTTPLPADVPPTSAIKNTAATTALLQGNTDSAIDTYHSLVQEGHEGGNQILSTLTQQNATKQSSKDLSTLTTQLADPSVSLEQKQAALKGFKTSDFLKDRAVQLQSNMLSAPSKGETLDAEQARLSVSDQLTEMYNSRAVIQGMVNNAIAQFPDRTILGAFGDAFATTLPFNQQIVTSKIQRAINPNANIIDTFRTYLTPGKTQADIVAQLNNLPTDQKIAYAGQLIDAIKNNSSLLFGSDNQENAYQFLTQLSTGGIDGLDQFGTNAMAALDLLGAGGIVRAGAEGVEAAGRAIKGAKEAPRVEPSFGPKQYRGTEQPSPGNPPRAGEKAYRPGSRNEGVTDVPFQDMNGAGPGVTDVPFTETARQGPVGVGPNRQIYNTVPKLTQEPTSLGNRRGLIGGEQPPLLANPTARLAAAEEKVNTELAVVRKHPASPGELANHTNPEQARNMNDIATRPDADPEIAQAFYNNSPDQVYLNYHAGQVSEVGRGVDTIPSDIDQVARQASQPTDARQAFMVYDNLGDRYTDAERATALSHKQNYFDNATGISAVDGMAGHGVSLDGGTFHVSTVYESPQGSWNKAQDAWETVQYALRQEGIGPENMELLRKEGNQHVPVQYSADLPDGDYKVRIHAIRNMDNFDVITWDSLDVKRNYFDRIPQLVSTDKGSLSSYMLDASNMLHPTITGSAVNVDFQSAKLDKILIEHLKESSDIFKALPSDRYAKVRGYLIEANEKRIDYDVTDLMARGFSADEIKGIRKWRDYWDVHYDLENQDLVHSMRNRGIQVVDNGQTKLFAKPVPKSTNPNLFFDVNTQQVRGFGAGEKDLLYANGGTIAELVRPITINGTQVTHIVVPQTPQAYLRGLRDTDEVLNRLKGYFQKTYKAPKFVDKVQLNAQGVVTHRETVAVAGDIPTAELFRRRMSAGSTDNYVVRGDVRALTSDLTEAWDLNAASGRISQRHRGQTLVDASGVNTLGTTFIADPMDSAVRAANSISNRAISRPMIEATKERFMQQYGHLLPLEHGRPRYPRTIDEIGSHGEESTSAIADARTTFMMIQKLEHGFSNAMDNATKAWLNQIADLIGNQGWGTGERVLRAAADAGPQALARKAASNLYITANPLRQWVIQSWQAVRMLSYNPIGSVTGSIAKLSGDWLIAKTGATGFGYKPNTKFLKFVEDSGLLESVDRHTLVNSSMQYVADFGNKFARAKNIGLAPARALRRVGFDVGEGANRLGHLAAVFDRYERLAAGGNRAFDLSQGPVRAKAYSEASALMGDMTRAGEMPYTASTAGAIFQFLQAPHKILTQSFNRRLDPWTRVRLAVGDAAMFGVAPAGVIAGWLGLDKLTNGNTELMDYLDNGLVAMAFNHTINEFWPDSGKVDFSSLDPRGLDGIYKILGGLAGQYNMAEVIRNSPAGGLLSGSRVSTATRSIARFFNPNPEYDSNNPTTFLGMMNDIAALTSGWSNAQKAKLIVDTQRRASQFGDQIDQKATTPQAIAQLFGFGSYTQKELFELSQQNQKVNKAYEDDVRNKYKEIKQYYTEKFKNGDADPDWISGVTGAALNIYKDQPRALAIINKQMKYDLEQGDTGLVKQIIQRCGIPEPGAIHDTIDRAPNLSDDQKKRLHQICNDFETIRDKIKEK